MTTDTLRLDLVSSTELARREAENFRAVLGVVGFDRPPSIKEAGVPVTASMLHVLGDSSDLCEVWSVDDEDRKPLSRAANALRGLRFRCGAETLFGAVTVVEEPSASGAAAALAAATAAAYRSVFDTMAETRHPHLVRVWNTVPDINGLMDGLIDSEEPEGEERYRHFNAARQFAFRVAGRSTVGTVPAASALGSPRGSPLSIYFLASTHAPTMIENPRQTSAYLYPPKFGAHSPTFSRACILPRNRGTNLFVSGTASIVGHETIHPGDVTAQTHETLANIEALLDEANRVVGCPRYALDGLRFKVYVRHLADLVQIQRVMASTVCATLPIVYVQADVCRADLMVEIEATGEWKPTE